MGKKGGGSPPFNNFFQRGCFSQPLRRGFFPPRDEKGGAIIFFPRGAQIFFPQHTRGVGGVKRGKNPPSSFFIKTAEKFFPRHKGGKKYCAPIYNKKLGGGKNLRARYYIQRERIWAPPHHTIISPQQGGGSPKREIKLSQPKKSRGVLLYSTYHETPNKGGGPQ